MISLIQLHDYINYYIDIFMQQSININIFSYSRFKKHPKLTSTCHFPKNWNNMVLIICTKKQILVYPLFVPFYQFSFWVFIYPPMFKLSFFGGSKVYLNFTFFFFLQMILCVSLVFNSIIFLTNPFSHIRLPFNTKSKTSTT